MVKEIINSKNILKELESYYKQFYKNQKKKKIDTKILNNSTKI